MVEQPEQRGHTVLVGETIVKTVEEVRAELAARATPELVMRHETPSNSTDATHDANE